MNLVEKLAGILVTREGCRDVASAEVGAGEVQTGQIGEERGDVSQVVPAQVLTRLDGPDEVRDLLSAER